MPQAVADGHSAAEPQPQRRKGAKTQRKRRKDKLFFFFFASYRLCVFAVAALPP
jgi:hypothetical protein